MGRIPLKIRLLRTLRESPIPVPTTDLSALCAGRFSRPLTVTRTELVRMERLGIVARFPPLPTGRRGRPTVRWALARGA